MFLKKGYRQRKKHNKKIKEKKMKDTRKTQKTPKTEKTKRKINLKLAKNKKKTKHIHTERENSEEKINLENIRK